MLVALEVSNNLSDVFVSFGLKSYCEIWVFLLDDIKCAIVELLERIIVYEVYCPCCHQAFENCVAQARCTICAG